MTTPITTIPLETVDGKAATLGDYDGKVLLVVNVASKCGLTPQYAALEALYRQYRARGFEVLGFPANEFGGQEPGTNDEIKAFCSLTYDVSFPLFAKIVVQGEGRHPLYTELTRSAPTAQARPGTDLRGALRGYGITPSHPPEILWNFEKFLIDRHGQVVERFAPDVPPDDALIVAAIERALA